MVSLLNFITREVDIVQGFFFAPVDRHTLYI